MPSIIAFIIIFILAFIFVEVITTRSLTIKNIITALMCAVITAGITSIAQCFGITDILSKIIVIGFFIICCITVVGLLILQALDSED